MWRVFWYKIGFVLVINESKFRRHLFFENFVSGNKVLEIMVSWNKISAETFSKKIMYLDLVLPSYENHSTDLKHKHVEWFLYDWVIGLK